MFHILSQSPFFKGLQPDDIQHIFSGVSYTTRSYTKGQTIAQREEEVLGLYIVIEGKEYLTSKNISEWENRLPDQNFCRIHRSTIINFDYIVNIDHNYTGTAEVTVQGIGESLNISRNYFRKLKGRYSL